MLGTYADFSPTPFDSKGAFLDDRQAWLVAPVSQTRDSEPLEQSNYAMALESFAEVDPDGDDYEEHRFGHWGPGWFEIIIVRPGSKCADVAEEIACALEDYPVLDESDFSQRELDAAQETWNCYSLADRIELCVAAGLSMFAARHDGFPCDDQGYIQERLLGH